ncbi:hypothetical protein GCM10009584_15770 [Ornithinimicrobium humiphilum]|uniref:Toxin-antitoxin system HicB family antitoxin n=1 Tax=Ornithinimicrobium humiphilum TaxID=125288 RepID=A0A543KKZ0_9MICO|nr:hypothetical protein FB476_0518 [Ornithinimicrobium humiphilum]
MDDDIGATEEPRQRRPKPQRKSVLLRLDPAVHEALQRWAADELRSVNAQIEMVLRDALRSAGRAPRDADPLPRRGRPPKDAASQDGPHEDG